MKAAFEIRPIDKPPYLDAVARQANQVLANIQERLPRAQPLLLKSVRHSFSELWLPGYLPDGFDGERAIVQQVDRQRPAIGYPHDEREGILAVSWAALEDQPFEYVARAVGAFRRVEGAEGYLIRGGWRIDVDESGAVVGAGWRTGHSLKLIVPAVERSQIITLEARPADLITEAEMLRVGRSLDYVASRPSLWLPFLRR